MAKNNRNNENKYKNKVKQYRDSDELEKLSWYISDGAMVILGIDYFDLYDLSKSVSVGFLNIGTQMDLVIVVGFAFAILSLFYKLDG